MSADDRKNRIPSKMNLLLSVIAISIISFLVISTIHFQSVSAQVSVQQAIDYWEQCKAIFGHDICKGMVGLGEQVHLLPARRT